jgi:hypothetical protein
MIGALASTAANVWTSSIQQNSTSQNNYAYSRIGVNGRDGNREIPYRSIPGAMAVTTYHPGQTPEYTIQISSDAFSTVPISPRP